MARMVILGASGTGKSYYLGWVIEKAAPKFDFVCHFDLENEEIGLSEAKNPLLQTLVIDKNRYENLDLARVWYRNKRIRVVPTGLTMKEKKDLYGRLCRIAMIFAEEKDYGTVFVTCDEAHNVVPQEQNMDERVERLQTGGRKHGAETVHASQRPQLLHKTALSQVDRAVYFRISGSNDIAKINKESEIDANRLKTLGKRRCIVENRDSGESVVVDTNTIDRKTHHYSGDDGIVDEVLPV